MMHVKKCDVAEGLAKLRDSITIEEGAVNAQKSGILLFKEFIEGLS